MEKLKSIVLKLGDNIQKVGLAAIALVVVLIVIVLVTGEKPPYFNLVAYPLMVVYYTVPFLCDKIRDEDPSYNLRRMIWGGVIIYCLTGLF